MTIRSIAPLTALLTLLVSIPAGAQDDDPEGTAASDAGASAEGGLAAQLEMEGESDTGAAPAAAVTGFGSAGTFAIGVERLFGFAQTSSTVEVEDQAVSTKDESKNTSAYFLTNNAGGPLGGPFVTPRVGFDFFVIDRISVGLALGYANDSGETEQTQNGNPQGEVEIARTAYIVSPRAGYAYMFSPSVGIWPRLGVSYAKVTDTVADTDTSRSVFAISGEVLLVLAPVEHVGFTLGPTVDFGLFGSADVDVGGGQTRDADSVNVTTLGLQVGMLTWF